MATSKASSASAARAAAEEEESARVREAEIAAKVPMSAYDPNDPNMTEKVHIRIPVDRVNQGNNSVTVGLNGVFFTIQRGKDVEVPRAVAEIIYNSQMQEDRALEYMENLPNAAAPG